MRLVDQVRLYVQGWNKKEDNHNVVYCQVAGGNSNLAFSRIKDPGKLARFGARAISQ